MTSDTQQNIGIGAAVVLIFALIFGALILVVSYQCQREWERSGMAVEFRLLAGCQVQHNGHWIPATSYREIP